GLHVVLSYTNFAIWFHNKGRANYALDLLAVVILFTESAVGGQRFFFGVRQQWEVEIVVFAELRQRLWLVRGNTQHSDLRAVELFHGVTELTGFGGAPRGICARAEVNYNPLSSVIGHGDRVSRIILQRECRCRGSNFYPNLLSQAFGSAGG